jgi:nucleoside-diphosphate-sugar epimerase
VKVFVTGATGVVGRRAVPLLVAAGHAVTAAARTPEKRAALEMAGAAGAEVDLFHPESLRRALAGQDAVLNLATHIPRSWRVFLRGAWKENDRIRRIGSANLVDSAISAGVSRFVQESFAPVYPDRGDRWIDESTPIAPVRYNRTVSDAEGSAARFTRSGGAGVVLRFADFYGPDAVQVHDMIRFVRKGWAAIPGRADAYLSAVSHDDAATAAVAVMGAPAGVYNVTDDEPVTRREFFDLLAKAVGVPSPKIPPAWVARLGGSLGEMLARSLRISNRKLRETTGWRPRYPSMREGWPAVVAEIGR